MTFAGIKNDQQRADVIDYLHTLSDNPQPLPKAEAAQARRAAAQRRPQRARRQAGRGSAAAARGRAGSAAEVARRSNCNVDSGRAHARPFRRDGRLRRLATEI